MDEERELRERIAGVMREVGEDQAGFARQVGESPQNVSNYLSGRSKKIPVSFLSKIVDRYRELNADWLLTGKGDVLEREKGGPAPLVLHINQEGDFEGIPVVGRIAAGALVPQYVAEHADEFIPLDATHFVRGKGDLLFGLRITGDSMSPWMLEGDVAVCSAFQTPEVGDDVCLYQYDSGESSVKRLEAINRNTGLLRLRPINPLYDSFLIEMNRNDQLKKVVAIWRDYRMVRVRQRRVA